MSSNHSTFCLKIREHAVGKIEFAAEGGLKSYGGRCGVQDFIIVPQDDSNDQNNIPWIDWFSGLNCYHLYSWLADVRGNLMPLPNYLENKKKTKEFMEWMDKSALSGCTPFVYANWRLGKDADRHHYSSDYKKHPLTEQLSMDENDVVMFSLEFLLNYDYDQVALIQDDEKEIWDEVNYEFIPGGSLPHPEGKTYRQLFFPDYFKFLELAKQAEFDAVIIAIS